MSKEIEFRGLTFDGKYIYGLPTYLVQENYEEGIIDGIRTNWGTNEDIHPESLSRYTGRKDDTNEATKLYEKDFVKGKFYSTSGFIDVEGFITFEDCQFKVIAGDELNRWSLNLVEFIEFIPFKLEKDDKN